MTAPPLRYRIGIFVVLLVIAASCVYPVLFMAINAVKDNSDYVVSPYGLPDEVTWSNVRRLVDDYDVLSALRNSVLVSIVGVAVSTFVAAFAAFPLAKIDFPGRKLVWALVISMVLVPSQVLFIPAYLMFSDLGLINNELSVILLYTARAIPFGVFLLASTFRAIPNELLESSEVDGSSTWQTFRSIVLPMGRPAMATLSIISFLTMWNELLLGYLLVPDPGKQLLTPALALLGGQHTTDQPLVLAGLLISALPPILVLALLSRFLVKGIAAGSVR
jgi:raffinose/stachyose/melibiose transport system permease protein